MKESPHQSPEADGNGLLGGERLAAARRAHEISATDIAKELHLDELKIRALEKNDFAVLGAPVFAKGHLRKYAELVGVPADDVLADYYKLNRSAGAPPVVGPVRKFRREVSLGPWIAGGVVAVIIASVAYWLFTRGPSLPFTQADPGRVASFVPENRGARTRDTTPAPVSTVTATEPLPDVAAAPPPVTTRAATAPATSKAEPLLEKAILPPQLHLELTFVGESWTEVTDASGRRLFYDLGTAGRVVAVAGEEPLQLVLGDSGNVQIAVEGREYPIPDAARRGRMARLTISSQ